MWDDAKQMGAIAATLLVLVAAGSSSTLRGQTPARKKLLFLTHAALYKHSSAHVTGGIRWALGIEN